MKLEHAVDNCCPAHRVVLNRCEQNKQLLWIRFEAFCDVTTFTNLSFTTLTLPNRSTQEEYERIHVFTLRNWWWWLIALSSGVTLSKSDARGSGKMRVKLYNLQLVNNGVAIGMRFLKFEECDVHVRSFLSDMQHPSSSSHRSLSEK